MGQAVTVDPFVIPSFTTAGAGQPSDGIRRTLDGRPYVHNPAAGKEVIYTRVTTFIDCLEDKFFLEGWKTERAMIGLSVRDDLVERVQGADPDDRDELKAIIADAQEAGGIHEAAKAGTDRHGLVELIHKGLPLPADIDRAALADLAAYRDLLAEWGLSPVPGTVEKFVVNHELKMGGTPDVLMTWAKPPPAYAPTVYRSLGIVTDLKTGRVDYGAGKMAMQLAAYARCRPYDPARPTTQPEKLCDVSQQVGLVIHLPLGQARADLYAVDLVVGWAGVQLAAAVRAFRTASTAKKVLTNLTTSY